MTRDDTHNPELYTMSFGDHLEELRRRVLLALIVPIPLMVILFPFTSTILQWITAPLIRVLKHYHLPETLQVLNPAEALLTQMKIAILGAIVLSLPWMLWQFWRFIQPGLYAQERRFVYFLVPGSAILTTLGISLFYFVMLPLVLFVLVGFGSSMTIVPSPSTTPVPLVELAEPPLQIPSIIGQPDPLAEGMMWISPPSDLNVVIRSGDELIILRSQLTSPTGVDQAFQLTAYVSFVLLLTFGMVIAFQTPLVILLLGWVGIVTPQLLRRYRKQSVMICAIVSMVITPADPWSMIAMLVPLYGLYELGIVLLVLAPAKKVASGTIFGGAPADESGPEESDRSN